MGASSYIFNSVFKNMMHSVQRIHGGPDASGAARFDFSTNSNACGPCPAALAAVQGADATQYPDGSYTALRCQLAAMHGVAAQRIVVAASASEFIFRITALARLQGASTVALPPHSYGDYAHAAAACGLSTTSDASSAQLVWACEPSSPLGARHVDWTRGSQFTVLDRAYEPLRLSGLPSLSTTALESVWQLYSPNKALGLTGVRAAYAIAPFNADEEIHAMHQLCPSWPVGAHGVAMLQAWTQPESQAWLAGSLRTLGLWKKSQIKLCESLGWTALPSLANFFVCKADIDLAELRQHGIKLRDCASFGLPGHVRLSVQPPAAQNALHNAWLHIKGTT